MAKCYIVIHKNYADGEDAYAFYKEEHARKSVEEDIKTVENDLTADGYKPLTSRKIVGNDLVNAKVVANDGNIYYEWMIVPSDIQ